ncbi:MULTISPECIES: DUF1328 domain-containing protein [unclassified Dinoroseobacter]|uniref:DUF1328 domain-containing protein n=1 Tax=unclassified Dinoroseobacter TaxID=2620028 RepID=UPI003C7AE784
MSAWALVFFCAATVSAVFGFTEIAEASTGIARILFGAFAVLCVLSLVAHVLVGDQKKRPRAGNRLLSKQEKP